MKGTLTPRTYPIYLSGAVKLAAFAAAPLLTVAGGFVLFYAWRQTPLGLIFLLFGLALCYQILFTPYRIVVQADQTIHIISLLRRRQIVPADIQSITAGSGSLFCIVHRGGEILLPGFTDSHQLLSELQAANPKIEFRGC